MPKSRNGNTVTIARQAGPARPEIEIYESAPISHGVDLRQGEGTPIGTTFAPGRFGRIFPEFTRFPTNITDPLQFFAALAALGESMHATPSDDGPIPAGYTYLGQFIDHDITFDPTPLNEQVIDPLAVFNFRTPKLDLDCLYGAGPAGSPFLYRRNDPAKFIVGATVPSFPPGIPEQSLPNDLPRVVRSGFVAPGRDPNVRTDDNTGFALIGDPRNDENLVVAQLHLAILKFHNTIVDQLRAGGVPPDLLFSEARRLVTWHYQWVVLHDFLRRILDPAVLDDVLANGRHFYLPAGEAFIPLEFSVAAYRLGHSMVRDLYDYNGVFTSATLDLLFTFTGLSGTTAPIPTNWVIDWRRFVEVDPTVTPNMARQLDARIAPALGNLPGTPPGTPGSLAVRNLFRGAKMGLPSGQQVAAKLGVTPLTPAELSAGQQADVVTGPGFDVHSPLWWYILKEAELTQQSARLGAVGSRLVAEVFVGLLDLDPTSFRSQQPDFQPTLGPVVGQFTLADLLTVVGELNPIGL